MQMNSQSILVVEDDAGYRELLELSLREEGYQVSTVANHSEALHAFNDAHYDVVICDFRLPGQNGLDLIKDLKERAPRTAFILLTALGMAGQAKQAISQGADYYLVKGAVEPDTLALAVRKALEQKRLQEENERLRTGQRHEGGMEASVKQSPTMQAIWDQIAKVGSFRSPVLITGESGTGKEQIARSIHDQSPYNDSTFTTINIGSTPSTSLDSELFGYIKGAFPGADQYKKGLIEATDGGTVFFNDIADLARALQPKLLRVIQHGKLRRLGDSQERDVGVRIICATSRDLWAMMREGSFREDLLYGLNVIHLHIPPLRERPEDIPALADHLLSKMMEQQGMELKKLSPEALKLLMDYHWPGNSRELEAVLERAAILADSALITPEHLPEELQPAPQGITFHIPPNLISLKEVIRDLTEQAEKELIQRALSQTENNRTHAAKLLGISHRSLLYKLKDYNIR